MSEPNELTKPSVTIIMVPRERFSCTLDTLNVLFSNTSYPFTLICVDGNSPPEIRDGLRQQANERGFRLIRTEHFLSSNQARNLGLAKADSEWVVFLDNDCEVRPGWLSALIGCAIETKASAVAPLYFEGRWTDQRIHMAGGVVSVKQNGGSLSYKANNFHEKGHYLNVCGQINRAEVDLFEMHCVMLCMRMLEEIGPLDEKLLSAFEHDDLSLLVRRAGGTIFLEPEARVTYTFGALSKYDAAYAKLRWSDDWNRRTISHFRKKWLLGEAWEDEPIKWCNDHRRRILRETRTLSNLVRKAAKRAVVRLLGKKCWATLRGYLLSVGGVT